jgi:hypothetical protein
VTADCRVAPVPSRFSFRIALPFCLSSASIYNLIPLSLYLPIFYGDPSIPLFPSEPAAMDLFGILRFFCRRDVLLGER